MHVYIYLHGQKFSNFCYYYYEKKKKQKNVEADDRAIEPITLYSGVQRRGATIKIRQEEK